MQRRADAQAAGLLDEVADGRVSVEGKLVADLLPKAAVVDAPAEAKEADRVAVEAPGPKLAAEPRQSRLEERVRDRHAWPPGEPQRPAQRDRAGGRHVHRAPDLAVHRCLQGRR